MTTRKAVEMASDIDNGDQWKPPKDPSSNARGTRSDGSGSTTPLNRASKAGSGEAPSRGLNIRFR